MEERRCPTGCGQLDREDCKCGWSDFRLLVFLLFPEYNLVMPFMARPLSPLSVSLLRPSDQ